MMYYTTNDATNQEFCINFFALDGFLGFLLFETIDMTCILVDFVI